MIVWKRLGNNSLSAKIPQTKTNFKKGFIFSKHTETKLHILTKSLFPLIELLSLYTKIKLNKKFFANKLQENQRDRDR